MANMSYCRFQNTLRDIYDCKSALNEISNLNELSQDEAKAARRFIVLCREIAKDWEAVD